jgi:hypothetical protein
MPHFARSRAQLPLSLRRQQAFHPFTAPAREPGQRFNPRQVLGILAVGALTAALEDFEKARVRAIRVSRRHRGTATATARTQSRTWFHQTYGRPLTRKIGKPSWRAQ